MNYIPGFTNYLETTVPEYGPAPIMGAEPVVPQRAAVAPMTTEAVAPNYLSGLSPEALAGLYALPSSGNFNQGNYGSDFGSLDNVYGMNFGSDLGSGGSGGSLYKVNPYLQSFAAPLSDKGNPTAYGGGNIEVKSPTQTFRLLDKNTGQVVYEGVGYEGAQEAINRANALTAEGGAKAQWQIQTPNSQQESGYSVVANEKRSQSTAGDIASFALPAALAVLTGGMSLPAQMAAAGIGGAMGAGLAGKNPAKAGLLSAATAGIMGGSGANAAIGKAVGNVGGILAGKTAEEVAKQAAEKTAEQIVVTALSKAAQGAGNAIGNTLLSEGVKGGLNSVTGYKPPAEKFAEQPLPNMTAPAVDMYAVPAPIDVTALTRLAQGTGSAIGNAALSGAVKGPLSDIASTDQPKPTEKTAEDIEAEKNPMVVTGPTNLLPADFATSAATAAAANAANGTPNAPDRAEMTDAELDAYMNDVSKGGGLGSLLSDMTLAQKVNLLGLGVSAAGSLAGGGGGSGQSGTYTRGGGSLNPIFSAKLPAAGGLGNVGLNRTQRPMGDVDWLTYGTRPELNFFDYAAQNNPAPVTTPVPGNPAGPIMQQRDPMAMAKGGRSEFAVNGPGTGRSDDIPAVLSDGEYVIDAETVALLGDGSSKAGAKKLDDLRVKVRKHKGKKLAKGRFSANAKRPEAYLSGGRI